MCFTPQSATKEGRESMSKSLLKLITIATNNARKTREKYSLWDIILQSAPTKYPKLQIDCKAFTISPEINARIRFRVSC